MIRSVNENKARAKLHGGQRAVGRSGRWSVETVGGASVMILEPSLDPSALRGLEMLWIGPS